MKAITLWQPWASFVFMGWKTIETRLHSRFKGLVGQRIAIHAALKLEDAVLANKYTPLMNYSEIQSFWRDVEICRGKIICTAIVAAARWAPNVDFVEREEWNKKAMIEVAGKFCLFLEDITRLRERIPFRGRQVPFDVPYSIFKGDK